MINLFLAYAPEDLEYREKIGKHLSALKERGIVNEVCVQEILPGSDFEADSRRMMNQAQVILLLVSSDFIASNECQRLEDLAFSMKLRNQAKVIPVLVRPCLYDESYNKLQILPENRRAISDKLAWPSEDAALTHVAEKIQGLVLSMTNDSPMASPLPAPQIPNISSTKDTSSFISKARWKPIGAIIALVLLAFIFWSRPFQKANTPPGEAKEVKKENEATELLVVPNLIRKNWNTIKTENADTRKFQVQKGSEKVVCGTPAGTIIGQNPKAGETLKAGEEIQVQIAAIPKPDKAATIRGGNSLHTISNGQSYQESAWAMVNTNVVFSLEGTECSKGEVTVIHPLGGTAKHPIRAGERKSNSRFFGFGTIVVAFSSNDPDARLKVRIW